MRLILQPISALDRQGFAGDAAIHLLFDLAKGNEPAAFEKASFDLSQTILRIKQQSESLGATTSMAPLGVHPGFSKGGLKGAFSMRLKQEIVNTLSQANLSPIAVMIANNGVVPWIFYFGKVIDGQFVPLAQRFNDTNTLFEVFSEFRVPSIKTFAFPVFKDDRPQTNDFWKIEFTARNEPVSEKGKQAIAFIQDPRKGGQQPHRPELLNHLSCSTCHTASSFQARASLFQLEPAVQLGREGNSPTSFMTQDAAQEGEYNVRNFGYFVRRPSIAVRTLNESILVAQRANEILQFSIEGKQCKNLNAYVKCSASFKNDEFRGEIVDCYSKSCQ